MNFDYTGSNVIVTGGTRGIGRAITEAFIKSGASVTALYAGNREAAEKFASEMSTDRLKTEKLDVADYEAVEAFFDRYDKENESLEVVVNNAGIRRDAVLGMMSPGDWQKVLDINLSGTFNVSKFALMKMLQNRYGRIINITSPSGRLGFAGQANYAASKAGQVALAKSLAKEAGRRSITVNCVSPGFIETELLADLPEELIREYKKTVPLKRFGKPEEIASAVLYLASPEASYITGSVLEVTGGI